MKLLLATVCLLTISGLNFAQTEPPTTDKDKFHIFILAGQSNMTGNEATTNLDMVSHPRVFRYTEDDDGNIVWVPAVDPLHIEPESTIGVGPGLSFAKDLVLNDGSIYVGLIPLARGGTDLDRWVVNRPGAIGDLYRGAVQFGVRAETQGSLKGILWHQGENDASVFWRAEKYEGDFESVVTNFRLQFGNPALPFISGELSDTLHQGNDPAFLIELNNRNKVDAATRKVMAENPPSAFIENDGMTVLSDQVHYDSASQKEFGRRYSQAYRNLAYVDLQEYLEENTQRDLSNEEGYGPGWKQSDLFGNYNDSAFPIIEHELLGPVQFEVDGFGNIVINSAYLGTFKTSEGLIEANLPNGVFIVTDPETDNFVAFDAGAFGGTWLLYDYETETFVTSEELFPQTSLNFYNLGEAATLQTQIAAVESTMALNTSDFGKVVYAMRKAEYHRNLILWLAEELRSLIPDVIIAIEDGENIVPFADGLEWVERFYNDLMPIADQSLITCQENFVAAQAVQNN